MDKSQFKFEIKFLKRHAPVILNGVKELSEGKQNCAKNYEGPSPAEGLSPAEGPSPAEGQVSG